MPSRGKPGKETVTGGRILGLFVALALLLGATLVFRGAGRWLIREDSLAPADAIVVLSGSMPYRAEEAARIFQQGYAREVWVSRPESVASELGAMGIHFEGEEDYNREVLFHAGVPDGDVRVFPDAIVNTEQEVEEVTREMRQQKKSSVIIVTSPQHTRRVRALWHKIAGRDMKMVVRAAPEDPFDAAHWWRHTRDIFSVVREMLGLANVWAGLPVHPSS